MVSPRDLVREDILQLSPYHVPDAGCMVKLDAMENPYAPPEPLRALVSEVAREAALNRYPDPSASRLKSRLRSAMAIPPGMEVAVGNGSDEIIQMICLALARPGAKVMSVEPTFVMFRMIATYAGMGYTAVPLGEGFALDADAMIRAMEVHRPAVVFLAYPNNPTGNLFDADAVDAVIGRAPGLVVVDEAYHAFAGRTCMDRLASRPYLLVMRTLSKLGLAGLRLGLVAGAPAWLAEIDKLRLPYNVNTLSQLLAERIMAEPEALLAQAAAIREARSGLFQALSRLPGVDPYPSDANFILFRVAGADRVFAGLKSRGVLIKNLSGSHPRLADCLRVTVGTPEENGTFLEALRATLAA